MTKRHKANKGGLVRKDRDLKLVSRNKISRSSWRWRRVSRHTFYAVADLSGTREHVSTTVSTDSQQPAAGFAVTRIMAEVPGKTRK